MPESPSSSFIPKRGIGKKPTVVRKSNFVLLSIISYALFVSAPLASAAVFIYERHTQNQFNKAVVNLDQAIEDFKEEDLRRVTEFSQRLTLTKDLLGSHVSIDALLRNIESATAQTVAFQSIDVTRVDKSTLTVTGLLATDAFDGALFQRSAYDAKEIIKNPIFSDVKLVLPAQEGEATVSATNKTVEFKVAFTVAVADILYSPVTPFEEQADVSEALENETPEAADSDNQDNTNI